MSFDAAAFGPITLNHLPPFAQRLRHAVHVETRMGRVRRTMDERWARALRAKGIDIDEADGAGGKQAHDGKRHTDITGTGRRPESQPAAGAPRSIQYQYESAGAEGDGTRHAIQGHRS